MKPREKILYLTVILALYFSLCHTTQYQVFMDEFFEYGSGMKLFSQGHFADAFFNHGIINPIITEICAHIVGTEQSFFAARLCQLIMGAGSCIAFFYLASLFVAPATAFLSTVFFAISPYFNISSHRLLADNPATLTFILTLTFLARWKRNLRKTSLLLAGFFYGLSMASKLIMVVYLPLFAVLAGLNYMEKTKERKNENLFLLSFLALTYTFWLILMFSREGYPDLIQIAVISICIFSCFLLIKKSGFIYTVKIFLSAKKTWVNIISFFASSVLSFSIMFPHIFIHYREFWHKFSDIELAREAMTDSPLRVYPLINKLPFSGYAAYMDELRAIGFPALILLLVIPGIFYVSYRVFTGKDKDSQFNGLWALIVLTSVYGFLIIGIWKVWYLRYIMHLFPLFSLIAVQFLFVCFDYLMEGAKELKKNSFTAGLLCKSVLVAVLFLSFLSGYLMSYRINKIRTSDNGFYLMAQKLSETAKPGELICFKYWQSYSLGSFLYGKPYGPYALAMSGVPGNVILNEFTGDNKEMDAFCNIVVSGDPIDSKWLVLIDKVSSENTVTKSFAETVFGTSKIEGSKSEAIEELKHFYFRSGGGYPMNFWIYKNTHFAYQDKQE